MDNREREKFYSSPPADVDDSDEYELEPPDEAVIADEARRAREAIEATNASIDIDEIYRDADRQRSEQILENWVRDFRQGFRFRIKHLLVATAVLAIVLTLAKLEILGTTVVLLAMISIAGLFFYLQWQEKKAQEEAAERRREMYARRRAHFEKVMRGPDDRSTAGEPASVAQPLPNEVDQTWQEAVAREKFRLRFSMGELMIAMTTAAVIFALVHIMGSASAAATLLGFVALFGLVVHALGFEPPGVVVLGWWLILVLYVTLSIFAAIWSGFA